MAVNLLPLGAIPKATEITSWILRELYRAGTPHVAAFLQNPTGHVERLGDLLVWQGEHGTRVLAGLEQVQEHSLRIQSLVENVQTTQILTSASLGALHTMSCLSMGITGTSGLLLFSRLKSMNNLCLQLQKQLKRIQNHLDINDLADLRTGISSLQKYESTESRSSPQLDSTVERCNQVGHRYQLHLQRELGSHPAIELKAVSYFHRCLLIALTTEVRCLTHQSDFRGAQTALKHRQPVLKQAAKVMFDQVIGTAPERYLDPGLQADNVSLSLLTEIYQQARQVEAIAPDSAQSATALFEELRPKIFGSVRGWWGLFALKGKAKSIAMEKLRFLMACLEETNRVESLRIRLTHAAEHGHSLVEWEQATQSFTAAQDPLSSTELPILAYAFN